MGVSEGESEVRSGMPATLPDMTRNASLPVSCMICMDGIV